MMTLDFTFERRLELQREEAIEEGIELGRAEEICELIRKKMQKKKSLEQIADDLEKTPDTIRPIYDQIAKELQQED